jgi:hypothetical protein
MMPQVSSVSDDTIWSIIITLLESSSMLLENIYSTGINHDHCHMMIIICLYYRPQVGSDRNSKAIFTQAKKHSRYLTLQLAMTI